MLSESVNVRVTGPLRDYLQHQISPNGLYENASEYVRDLIRKDKARKEEAWAWLRAELEPLLEIPESEYIEVSAEDVIRRNTKP